MLLTVCFPHSVVAKEECTITPLNPTTLTFTGGALASGTENVTIQCSCTVNNDSAKIRWYNPDGSQIYHEGHMHHVNGTPYSTIRDNDTNITLVIPKFNDSYDGIYNCGRKVNNITFVAPSAATVLYIAGELMIIIS